MKEFTAVVYDLNPEEVILMFCNGNYQHLDGMYLNGVGVPENIEDEISSIFSGYEKMDSIAWGKAITKAIQAGHKVHFISIGEFL